MTKIVSKRVCAGLYDVTTTDKDDTRVVSVTYHEEYGWMARADWDQYIYSDPSDTKREAMESARNILENTDNDGRFK